jgi:hypothetical protein
VIAVGSGEGAAAVAEELAFEEVAGDRGAVEGDEGLVGAIGEVMNRAGENFFAGAALARYRPVAADGGSRSICRRTTARGCGSVPEEAPGSDRCRAAVS